MQLKVKDFAAEMHVSESIIYRHIRQHREALGDRVIKKAKATWLTDEGQDYIRNLMVLPEPSVVLRDHPEMEDLRAEIQELRANASRQAEAHAAVVQMLAAEKARADGLALKAAKVELLEAAAADREKSLTEAQEKAAKAQVEAEQAAKVSEDLRHQLEEAEAKLTALKERNWLDRLFRKGE